MIKWFRTRRAGGGDGSPHRRRTSAGRTPNGLGCRVVALNVEGCNPERRRRSSAGFQRAAEPELGLGAPPSPAHGLPPTLSPLCFPFFLFFFFFFFFFLLSSFIYLFSLIARHDYRGARPGPSPAFIPVESGPLRAVHLSRHKWPGGLVN